MHEDIWGNSLFGYCSPADQYKSILVIPAGSTFLPFPDAVPADRTLQILFVGCAYPAGVTTDPSTGMYLVSATDFAGPIMTINGAGPFPISPVNWILPLGETPQVGLFPAVPAVDVTFWVGGRLLPPATYASL
jgi:hypothetical protein